GVKMKKKNNSMQVIFGFIILGLLAWGIIKIGLLFWKSITSLQPDLASALITASGTVIVVFLSSYVGKYFERKKEIENRQREKKIEVYEEFMQKWFEKLVENKKQEKSFSDDEFIKFLSKFTQKLILWGSDKVVKKYSQFRKQSLNTETSDPTLTLYSFEEVLLEIRKDIGHSNSSLIKGDILTLFINDIK
ncbi:MAG: hypothetical protein ACYC59_11500, partial [Anaerolineaceae bacterium]